MEKQTLNPDDFVITRKRKKYKFAKFANSELCYEFDEWQPRTINSIEIGAGDGMFSVERAALNPEHQFMAIDVKADRLQKGAYEAEERGLKNIVFLRARADQLSEIIEPQSVQSIWITFPDPFPKKRSARRRLTHALYLEKYANVLVANGNVYFKHDSLPFFLWSLEQLVESKWCIEELSFDLHDSELPNDYKFKTTYETRWMSEGSSIHFVSARKLVH